MQSTTMVSLRRGLLEAGVLKRRNEEVSVFNRSREMESVNKLTAYYGQ